MIHPNGNSTPVVGARRPAGRKGAAALALAAWLTQLAAPALSAPASPADSTWASRARECAASARQVRFQVGQRIVEPEFFSVEAAGIRCEASPGAASREYESSSLTARRRPTTVELRLVPWDEISRVDIRTVRPSGGGLIGLLVGGGLGALAVSGSKPEGPFAFMAAPYYVAAAIVLVGGGAVLGAVIGSSPRDTGWVTCCRRDSATTAADPPVPTP